MNNHIDFYFDIISPYAYIAYKKILKHNNILLNYKPIFLGGLHNLAGIEAPAFNKYKMNNMKNDCDLVALKNNIEFKWNSKFPINSLNLMRGYICVNEDKRDQYLNCFFDAYWKDGLNLNSDNILNSILTNLNINFNEFQLIISEQKIKNKLTVQTNEAYNKGVFGAPSFIINNKLFWGQDRLEFVLKEAQR